MTKKTKKLSLNKETLTKLNEAALARAAGGSGVCEGFGFIAASVICPSKGQHILGRC